MKGIKIFNVPSEYCWVLFIVLQVSIIAFMVATLAVEQWVKLDPDDYPRYYFEGGVLKVTDGLDAIINPFLPTNTVDVSDTIYAKLACSAKFITDMYSPNILNFQSEQGQKFTLHSQQLFKSWHKLFTSLWFSGGLFLVFELFALISSAIIIVTISLIFVQRYYFHLNFCAAGCLWVSHIIAIIGWLGLNDITFEDDCNDLTDGNDAPTVCVLTGPKLGIFVLIYTTFVMILYFVVVIAYVLKASKIEGNPITDSSKTENKTYRVKSHGGEDQVKLN